MELFPAIDVRAGRCVRLRRGDYAAETVYDEDPVAVAAGFVAAGARWVHVVDLDAARTGEPVNRDVVAAVAAVVRGAGARVQSGGGVRDEASAAALWDAGVTRVVLGTAAVQTPDLVARLAAVRPGGVAVGLDTRRGEVAVQGWAAGSGITALEMVARLAGAGVAAFVVTDISRDGMLTGPDVDGLGGVLDATEVDVLASGGVSAAADLDALGRLRGPATGRRLAGVVVGRAIYEGRLSVEEGVAACAASV
jgi:phosphoribosylformimino-5-aminoimidazole carboxamide ribotide isomerase